jgi:DNA-directed RNA polymerase specialized sigma24 family protein
MHICAPSDPSEASKGEGRAWLLAIVRNLCYDSMKRKSVCERPAPFDEALHNTCLAPSDPEREAMSLRRQPCKRPRKSRGRDTMRAPILTIACAGADKSGLERHR